MKVKTRNKPLPLRKLDAAIPRLSQNFPGLPKMKEDVKIQQKGYSGELKVDYHLDMLAPTHTILEDVYLRVNGKNFQIDSLIGSKHAFYIVDSKDIDGTVTFNTTLRQLIRENGKIESGFKYPITQVKNQKFHFQNWLPQHNLAHIPVYSYVAIADTSTIIKVEGDSEEIGRMVAHGASIPEMIMDRDKSIAKLRGQELQHYQIGKTILRGCGVFDIDFYKNYGLRPTQLLPGVICPNCRLRGMERVYNGWICGRCKYFSRDAHKEALMAYLLLVKPYITNSECMRWLCFNSKNIATKLLREYPLHYDKNHRRWAL